MTVSKVSLNVVPLDLGSYELERKTNVQVRNHNTSIHKEKDWEAYSNFIALLSV